MSFIYAVNFWAKPSDERRKQPYGASSTSLAVVISFLCLMYHFHYLPLWDISAAITISIQLDIQYSVSGPSSEKTQPQRGFDWALDGPDASCFIIRKEKELAACNATCILSFGEPKDWRIPRSGMPLTLFIQSPSCQAVTFHQQLRVEAFWKCVVLWQVIPRGLASGFRWSSD